MAYDFLFVFKVIWVSEELLTEQNQSLDLCLQIGFVVWVGKPQGTEQGLREPVTRVSFQLFWHTLDYLNHKSIFSLESASQTDRSLLYQGAT